MLQLPTGGTIQFRRLEFTIQMPPKTRMSGVYGLLEPGPVRETEMHSMLSTLAPATVSWTSQNILEILAPFPHYQNTLTLI